MKLVFLTVALCALAVASPAPENIPLVSVVVPTSRQALIPRLIDQVELQDYPNIELVIVDDSETPLKDSRLSYSWVKYHFVAPMSIGEKRNLGLKASTGDFIAHWDDDDLFRSNRLREQVRPLVFGQADVTFLEHDIVWDVVNQKFFSNKMYDLDPHYATMVYRRPHDIDVAYPDVSLAEDYQFAEQLLGNGYRMRVLANKGMHIYVRHRDNTFGTTEMDESMYEEIPAPSSVTDADKAFYYSNVFSGATAQHSTPPNKVLSSSTQWNVPEMNAARFKDTRQPTFNGMCMNYPFSYNDNNCPVEANMGLEFVITGGDCFSASVDISSLFTDPEGAPLICSNLQGPVPAGVTLTSDCLLTGSDFTTDFEMQTLMATATEDLSAFTSPPMPTMATGTFDLTVDCIPSGACTMAGVECQAEDVSGAAGMCVDDGMSGFMCMLNSLDLDVVQSDVTMNDTTNDPTISATVNLSGNMATFEGQTFMLDASVALDGGDQDDDVVINFDSGNPTTSNLMIDLATGNDSVSFSNAEDFSFDLGMSTFTSGSSSGAIMNTETINVGDSDSNTLIGSNGAAFTFTATPNSDGFSVAASGSTISFDDIESAINIDTTAAGDSTIDFGQNGVLDGISSATDFTINTSGGDNISVNTENDMVSFTFGGASSGNIDINNFDGNTVMGGTFDINGATITLNLDPSFTPTPDSMITVFSAASLVNGGMATFVLGAGAPAGSMLSVVGNDIIFSVPGAATGGGDPHMVGFFGQRYNFMGAIGHYYSFISWADLQINVRMTGEFRSGAAAPTTLMDEVWIKFGGHEFEWTVNKSPMIDGNRKFNYGSNELRGLSRETRFERFKIDYESAEGEMWRKHPIISRITIIHPEAEYKITINMINKHAHKDWTFFDIDISLEDNTNYVPQLMGSGGFLGQTLNRDDPSVNPKLFEVDELKSLPN